MPVLASGWLTAELAGTISVGMLLGMLAVVGSGLVELGVVAVGASVGVEILSTSLLLVAEARVYTIKPDAVGVYAASEARAEALAEA